MQYAAPIIQLASRKVTWYIGQSARLGQRTLVSGLLLAIGGAGMQVAEQHAGRSVVNKGKIFVGT